MACFRQGVPGIENATVAVFKTVKSQKPIDGKKRPINHFASIYTSVFLKKLSVFATDPDQFSKVFQSLGVPIEY
jgi:hypothetical protein